nr:hypothetical protein [Tanacetum cinerariifolium]
MDFVSSPSPNSTNEVLADFEVSTASPQVSTANLSDATVYAFLANQPNGSQLMHEDLEQIHEDDLEEIDLKWQLALLSMRTKRFFQKTGMKITINGSDTAELVLVGATWLMMKLPQTWLYTDNTCSKTYLNNYATLKTQYDELRVEFNKSKCNLAYYKRGLASVEEQLVHYKMNESLSNENIAVLKIDILIKDSEIAVLKSKLEKISKEKDVLETKIKKFENASQSLEKLIGSQITDNSKRGLGYVSYNDVLPPHTGRFSPPRIDFSHAGLPEFAKPREDEVESPPKVERKTVKPSVDKGHSHRQLEDQGYFDSGCFRHMTGNISYLTDFKELDRGYVAFREGAKDGKITGKGTIRTGKLDFEDVYFVKELADESYVLLKVPRKNNMYSIDMKNIVPKKDLTCLVAKTINNESML